MTFADNVLGLGRPDSIREDVSLPRRQPYYPSPVNWKDEVLYFLLVDRFSDGREDTRPLLDRQNPDHARRLPGGAPWRWDNWALSGAHRWQGGTLRAPGRQNNVPARLVTGADGVLELHPLPFRGSSDIVTAAAADALCVVPADTELEGGTMADYRPL